MTDPATTENGFRFGPMLVEAAAVFRRSNGDYTVVRIRTESGQKIDIYCSPNGRRLRVFREHKEMKTQ